MARPGTNRPAGKQTMSRNRYAWTTLPRLELSVYVGTERDPKEEIRTKEEEVNIFINKVGVRTTMPINLTMMTVEELAVLREFFNLAFDAAEPICAAIDRRAKEAYDAGDDTYLRLYRAVPKLHVRKRGEPAHVARVPNGSGVVPRLEDEATSAPVGPAALGGGLADGGPPDVGAQDDAAAPDDTPVLGALGRDADLPGGLPSPDPGEAPAPPPA